MGSFLNKSLDEVFERFRISLDEVTEATRNFSMGTTSSKVIQEFLRELGETPNQLRGQRRDHYWASSLNAVGRPF